MPSATIESIVNNPPVTDWHVTLGHPLDPYLWKFLKLHGVQSSSPVQLAKNCAIYNYSRYNRIYLQQTKCESESNILLYFNEIRNCFNRFLAVFHSDRGAKRFNQTLLMKFRCVLAQSNVLISYWDKAAKHCSMIINHLPSKSLDWQSPVGKLAEKDSTIEPTQDIHRIMPFGLKVNVHQRSAHSKIAPQACFLLFVGYEPRLDALRFLDLRNGRIFVSRDYTPSVVNFK